MELIGSAIEWVANQSVAFLLPLFPYAMVGLIGLYVLAALIGYLRVAQVGIQAEAVTGSASRLPRSAEGRLQVSKGVPYCPVDGLRYPAGARFCTQCESDLLVSCANCGATIRTADESCYRCGTRETTLVAAAH